MILYFKILCTRDATKRNKTQHIFKNKWELREAPIIILQRKIWGFRRTVYFLLAPSVLGAIIFFKCRFRLEIKKKTILSP